MHMLYDHFMKNNTHLRIKIRYKSESLFGMRDEIPPNFEEFGDLGLFPLRSLSAFPEE